MEAFKKMAKNVQMQTLAINTDVFTAEGIHIPEAVFSFCDAERSEISYSDTGVFILFKGSHVHCPAEKKYEAYIDKTLEITTREIVFQSRNAAAKFVLGEKGRTEDWK